VVLTGDGAAYGMGLFRDLGRDRPWPRFSLHLLRQRRLRQHRPADLGRHAHAARTATSGGSRGVPGFKKDLFAIWAAHRPVYVATVIGAEPLDLAKKIEKAKGMTGSRLVIALSPCPTGWEYDPRESVEIGRLAVKTGVWPLKEYVDGEVIHTHVPHPRLPVEEYLKKQGRFRHLFEPVRNAALIDEIQARVDAYWASVS